MGGAGLRAGGKVSAGWDREITELNTIVRVKLLKKQNTAHRRIPHAGMSTVHYCQLFGNNLWEKAPSSRRKGSTKNLVLRDTHVVR